MSHQQSDIDHNGPAELHKISDTSNTDIEEMAEVKKSIEHSGDDEAVTGDMADEKSIAAVYEASDPSIEKTLLRKFDMRLIPLFSVLYLLAFLDRSNIGNAKIAGMTEDLNLHGDRYEWLLTIFYISYIIFEFLILMYKVIPPHTWVAIVVFFWGVIATLQAVAQSWRSEMACRFFLGLSEAGYGTGIPYLLSFFYLRHELGFRVGMFLSAAPLASTFAGALAYGITSGHSRIANWRLLFLVEGIPTILMAPIAFFFIPDTPDHARFLNEDEKRVAKVRGVRQVGDSVRMGKIVWKDIILAFKDAKCWFTAFMYFSCNVSFSSLPVFLPEILKQMGFSSINAQGLTAPPYFVSWIITIASSWLADRLQQRGLTIIVLSFVGCVGYIMLVATENVAVRYVGTFLAAGGIFPSIANILPWVLNNQGSDTRRGTGIVILNLIGQCGPLLGTRVFPDDDAPRYVVGFSICAAFMFFNMLLALGLRMLLVVENRRLDRKFGTRGRVQGQGEDLATRKDGGEIGIENYGPEFRYTL